MGMAASQMRYLGLTARKTNVEYEGQQINQARTALANQSANTFNELLALEVPTAPSTQDFTELKYTYKDGTTAEEISSMTPLENDPDGYNYMITHFHYSDVFTGVESKKSNPQVVTADKTKDTTVPRGEITTATDGAGTTTYYKNGVPYTTYNPTDAAQKAAYDKIIADKPAFGTIPPADVRTFVDADGNISMTSTGALDAASVGLSDVTEYSVKKGVPTYMGNKPVSEYDPTDVDQKAAYEQILKDFPDSIFAGSSEIYTWKDGDKILFGCGEDMRAAAASGPDPLRPTENQEKMLYYNAQNVKTKIEKTEKAFVELDGSGRPQSIRFEDSSINFALNTETKTDENAYNDAMNQYNYDMQVYEKTIQDINAKTEKIQQEDRTLELRLKQLDTEQEALQTEMESVKKVIDKNIESTFKTFQ